MRWLWLLLLISCAELRPAQPWTHVGPSRVLEITTRRQCSACHSVESVFGTTAADQVESRVDACLREGHCAVPTLASMERFRASWLRAFLQAPVDVRPGLVEQMLPHLLAPSEVDALLAGWRAAQDEPAAPGELARGEALFQSKQCRTCHQLGGRVVIESPEVTELQRALAPDLQHTRHRMNLSTVERFIFSPASVKPTAQMARPGVTLDEAQALALFIYFAE